MPCADGCAEAVSLFFPMLDFVFFSGCKVVFSCIQSSIHLHASEELDHMYEFKLDVFTTCTYCAHFITRLSMLLLYASKIPIV